MPEVERVRVLKRNAAEISFGDKKYLLHEHPLKDAVCLLGESLGALPEETAEKLFGARGAFTVYGVREIKDFPSLNNEEFKALLAENGFAGRKIMHYPPEKWRKQIQKKLFPGA